jgi:transposase-like protein
VRLHKSTLQFHLFENVKMPKNYLTWREKQSIVDEAYSGGNTLKGTARRHKICASQIRRWKKRSQELFGNDENDDDEQPAIQDSKRRHLLSLKMVGAGGNRENEEAYADLRIFYDNLLNQDRIVSAGMLCYQFKRNNPTIEIEFGALRQRVYRWLRSEHIVQRRVTHVSQNTRFDQSKINDFVNYVNEQITNGAYTADDVVNIDETNIMFDMTGSITLANQGEKTISLRSSGSSSRCTVLLGVTLSGIKLPPFVIFRGSLKGRISREWNCQNSQFPETSYYTTQPKAWIDETTFLQWVEAVWQPFTENKGHLTGNQQSYLLMDECSVHLMGNCIEAVRQCSTEVDFILPGYTSKIQ